MKKSVYIELFSMPLVLFYFYAAFKNGAAYWDERFLDAVGVHMIGAMVGFVSFSLFIAKTSGNWSWRGLTYFVGTWAILVMTFTMFPAVSTSIQIGDFTIASWMIAIILAFMVAKTAHKREWSGDFLSGVLAAHWVLLFLEYKMHQGVLGNAHDALLKTFTLQGISGVYSSWWIMILVGILTTAMLNGINKSGAKDSQTEVAKEPVQEKALEPRKERVNIHPQPRQNKNSGVRLLNQTSQNNIKKLYPPGIGGGGKDRSSGVKNSSNDYKNM